jgi:mRNA interferase MazF
LKRGDLVMVAMAGEFGKPRPALVVQSDLFSECGTITVLLVSGTLVDAPLIRLTIEPTAENGLRKVSQLMIDKAISVRRDQVGPRFGRVDAETMLSMTRSLAVVLGIA